MSTAPDAPAPSRLEEARAELARRTAALDALQAETDAHAKRAAEIDAAPSLTTAQYVARENLARERDRLEARKAQEVAAIAQARAELDAAQREADGVLSIRGDVALWFTAPSSIALGPDSYGRERSPGVRMTLRPPGVLVSFSGGHLLDLKPRHRVLTVRFKEPLLVGTSMRSNFTEKDRDVVIELRDRERLTVRLQGATHVIPLSRACYCQLEATEAAPGVHGLVPYTSLTEIVLAREPSGTEERIRTCRIRLGLPRFPGLRIDAAAIGGDLRLHPAGVYAHMKGEHVILPTGNVVLAALAQD